jgi:hypothetical protein
MPLPLSREETATPASAVDSNTINALQDCIIGGKHGEITIAIGAGAFGIDTAANLTRNFGWLTWTGAATAIASLRLPVGARLTEVTYHYDRNGAGTIDFLLVQHTIPATPVTLDTTSISAGTGNASTTITPDYDVVADDEVMIKVSGTSGHVVKGVVFKLTVP